MTESPDYKSILQDHAPFLWSADLTQYEAYEILVALNYAGLGDAPAQDPPVGTGAGTDHLALILLALITCLVMK